MPSLSGMRTSMTTSSALQVRAIRTACSPSPASPTTSNPSAVRAIDSPMRNSGWSSATTTLTLRSAAPSLTPPPPVRSAGTAHPWPARWPVGPWPSRRPQVGEQRRAPRSRRLGHQAAAVGLEHAPRDEQPEPAGARRVALAGDLHALVVERLRQLVERRAQARPVVGDAHQAGEHLDADRAVGV